MTVHTHQIAAAPRLHWRRKFFYRLQKPGIYLILGLLALAILLPIASLVITSLKKDDEYLSYPIVWFPAVPQWHNYQLATTVFPFIKYVGNSLLLAFVFSVLTVGSSAMAGFAFSRLQSQRRQRLFSIVIALLMIPNIVFVIPQFVIFARVGLTNTYWPWVLWGVTGSPFHIFLFRQFFSSIPKELEEAAEIDGASIWRMFWQIFLPNAKPVIATSYMLNFIWVWGDWFTPLIYLSDNNTTLAVKLSRAYVNSQGFTLTTVALAGSVLYTIPILILFFVGQKQIVENAVTSGLKG